MQTAFWLLASNFDRMSRYKDPNTLDTTYTMGSDPVWLTAVNHSLLSMLFLLKAVTYILNILISPIVWLSTTISHLLMRTFRPLARYEVQRAQINSTFLEC